MVPGGGFSSPFSTLFRLRASMGHLWRSKWSQDLPQEPPGPPGKQFFVIFTQLLMPVLNSFYRFGAHSWRGGGGCPQGNWIYIYIYMLRVNVFVCVFLKAASCLKVYSTALFPNPPPRTAPELWNTPMLKLIRTDQKLSKLTVS